MDARFTGQVVLVTGAARGIGRAVAARFVRDGAQVIAFDLPGSGVAEAITAFGTAGVAIEGDVAVEDDVQRAVDAAAGFGRPLTALVNCAGVVSARPFLESDGGWFDRVMRVNARGAFLSSLAAGRAMALTGGGAIVQIASTCAYESGASRKLSAYNMSKGAVRQLVASLAGELAPHGIRVNAVAPGTIDTAMTRKCLPDDEALAALAATIPLRTVGQPDDVADACAFLCSTEARYITGHTLVVDGGWLVR
jgi:3-oxoacyl-[acyl-carrier protein] reductase